MQSNYDLIIVGGGIAGSLAAVSAARHGADTLLVEEGSYLGGSLTKCGTGPMMTFHAGATQVVRGVTDELIHRLVKKGLSVGHIPDSTGYTYTVTPFDSEGMKRELELMVTESGAKLLYHTVLDQVHVQDGLLKSCTFLSCGQHFDLSSKVWIDATGDCDLLWQSGVPCTEGRESDHASQPMTTNFKLEGVDIDAIRKLMDEDVTIFPFLVKHAGRQHQASRLSCSGFQKIMKQGIKDGEITFDRDIVLFFETNTKNEVIVNMTRINGLRPTDPLEYSQAEIEGRRQVWELYDFMKRKIPGFRHARMVSSGPSVGIRSSRQMVGSYTLTAHDILSERVFPDRIGVYGYPIDIHSPDGTATNSTFLRDGGSYTYPYGILTNPTIPNIMAAGRNVSASFEAQASTRTSPCCGAIGQAAGTAAVLAVKTNRLPTEIDVALLQKELLADGAYLG